MPPQTPPQFGNISIAQFAAKLKQIRPDLANVPDENLVRGVIKAAPQFQRYLSTDAVQQLNRSGTPGELGSLEHLAHEGWGLVKSFLPTLPLSPATPQEVQQYMTGPTPTDTKAMQAAQDVMQQTHGVVNPNAKGVEQVGTPNTPTWMKRAYHTVKAIGDVSPLGIITQPTNAVTGLGAEQLMEGKYLPGMTTIAGSLALAAAPVLAMKALGGSPAEATTSEAATTTAQPGSLDEALNNLPKAPEEQQVNLENMPTKTSAPLEDNEAAVEHQIKAAGLNPQQAEQYRAMAETQKSLGMPEGDATRISGRLRKLGFSPQERYAALRNMGLPPAVASEATVYARGEGAAERAYQNNWVGKRGTAYSLMTGQAPVPSVAPAPEISETIQNEVARLADVANRAREQGDEATANRLQVEANSLLQEFGPNKTLTIAGAPHAAATSATAQIPMSEADNPQTIANVQTNLADIRPHTPEEAHEVLRGLIDRANRGEPYARSVLSEYGVKLPGGSVPSMMAPGAIGASPDAGRFLNEVPPTETVPQTTPTLEPQVVGRLDFNKMAKSGQISTEKAQAIADAPEGEWRDGGKGVWFRRNGKMLEIGKVAAGTPPEVPTIPAPVAPTPRAPIAPEGDLNNMGTPQLERALLAKYPERGNELLHKAWVNSRFGPKYDYTDLLRAVIQRGPDIPELENAVEPPITEQMNRGGTQRVTTASAPAVKEELAATAAPKTEAPKLVPPENVDAAIERLPLKKGMKTRLHKLVKNGQINSIDDLKALFTPKETPEAATEPTRPATQAAPVAEAKPQPTVAPRTAEVVAKAGNGKISPELENQIRDEYEKAKQPIMMRNGMFGRPNANPFEHAIQRVFDRNNMDPADYADALERLRKKLLPNRVLAQKKAPYMQPLDVEGLKSLLDQVSDLEDKRDAATTPEQRAAYENQIDKTREQLVKRGFTSDVTAEALIKEATAKIDNADEIRRVAANGAAESALRSEMSEYPKWRRAETEDVVDKDTGKPVVEWQKLGTTTANDLREIYHNILGDQMEEVANTGAAKAPDNVDPAEWEKFRQAASAELEKLKTRLRDKMLEVKDEHLAMHPGEEIKPDDMLAAALEQIKADTGEDLPKDIKELRDIIGRDSTKLVYKGKAKPIVDENGVVKQPGNGKGTLEFWRRMFGKKLKRIPNDAEKNAYANRLQKQGQRLHKLSEIVAKLATGEEGGIRIGGNVPGEVKGEVPNDMSIADLRGKRLLKAAKARGLDAWEISEKHPTKFRGWISPDGRVFVHVPDEVAPDSNDFYTHEHMASKIEGKEFTPAWKNANNLIKKGWVRQAWQNGYTTDHPESPAFENQVNAIERARIFDRKTQSPLELDFRNGNYENGNARYWTAGEYKPEEHPNESMYESLKGMAKKAIAEQTTGMLEAKNRVDKLKGEGGAAGLGTVVSMASGGAIGYKIAGLPGAAVGMLVGSIAPKTISSIAEHMPEYGTYFTHISPNLVQAQKDGRYVLDAPVNDIGWYRRYMGSVSTWFTTPAVRDHLPSTAVNAARAVIDAKDAAEVTTRQFRERWVPAVKNISNQDWADTVKLLDDRRVNSGNVDQLPVNAGVKNAYKVTRGILDDQRVAMRNSIRQALVNDGFTADKAEQYIPDDWGIQEGYFPHVMKGAWAILKRVPGGEDGEGESYAPIETGWLQPTLNEANKIADQYTQDHPDDQIQVTNKQWANRRYTADAQGRLRQLAADLRTARSKGKATGNLDPDEIDRLANRAAASVYGPKASPRKFFGGAMARRRNLPGWLTDRGSFEQYLNNASRYIEMVKARPAIMNLRNTLAREIGEGSVDRPGRFPRRTSYKMLGKLDQAIEGLERYPNAFDSMMRRSLERNGFSAFALDRAQSRMTETWAMLKLGFSPISAVKHLFMVGTNTFSILGGKWTKAGIEGFVKNYSEYKPLLDRINLTKETVGPEDIGDFTSYAKAYRRFKDASLFMFKNNLFATRAVTAIGAYRKALAEGADDIDATKYARDTMIRTQGDYSAADRPGVLAAMPSVMRQFKTLPLKQLEFVMGLRKAEIARYMLAQVGIGILGTPGLYALNNVIQSATGYSPLTYLSQKMPRATRGVLGFAHIAVSHNLGFTEAFTPSENTIAGPAVGDMINAVKAAPGLAHDITGMGAGSQANQVAVNNFLNGLSPQLRRAYEYAENGSTLRDPNTGNVVMNKVTPIQRIMMAGGITPLDIAKERDANRMTEIERSRYLDQRSFVVNQIANAIWQARQSNDPAALASAHKQIEQIVANTKRTHPELLYNLDKSVQKRIQDMMLTREQRNMQRAPAPIRRNVMAMQLAAQQ